MPSLCCAQLKRASCARQDVTLKAGFGIPSNAVALFPQPVPMLEAMHHVYVQASRCALYRSEKPLNPKTPRKPYAPVQG